MQIKEKMESLDDIIIWRLVWAQNQACIPSTGERCRFSSSWPGYIPAFAANSTAHLNILLTHRTSLAIVFCCCSCYASAHVSGLSRSICILMLLLLGLVLLFFYGWLSKLFVQRRVRLCSSYGLFTVCIMERDYAMCIIMSSHICLNQNDIWIYRKW